MLHLDVDRVPAISHIPVTASNEFPNGDATFLQIFSHSTRPGFCLIAPGRIWPRVPRHRAFTPNLRLPPSIPPSPSWRNPGFRLPGTARGGGGGRGRGDIPISIWIFAFDPIRVDCEFCIDLIEWPDRWSSGLLFKGKMINWPNERFCLYAATVQFRVAKLVEYYRFSLRRFFYTRYFTRSQHPDLVNTVLVNTGSRETFEYHTFAFRKFLFGREFKVDYGLVYKLIRLTKVFYNVRTYERCCCARCVNYNTL